MRHLLLAVVVAAVVYSLATCVTQVQPGERAVIRRFGKILPDKPGPGLYVGLPWGMDRIDRVPIEMVRSIKVGMVKEIDEDSVTPPGQLLTGDHNLVNVQADIHYRILDNQVEQFVLQRDLADSLIARAAESAMAEWVAGKGVDDILLNGKVLLSPWLIDRVQGRIKDYHLGVEILLAKIVFVPPSEVKANFDAVNQEHTRITTQVNQAQQEAGRKMREGQGEKFRLESLTKAYAREQDLAARAEAETFVKRLDQFRRLASANPDYINTLWFDGMNRLYRSMRENGRIDVLDHYLSAEGLNLTQFPLLPRKK